MEIFLPFQGNYDITQGFGENPANYSQFHCSRCGNPLSGHNGVDFNLPEGTPVLACAPGHVLRVDNDPDGYGLHIHLSHDWGESIYAHLSQSYVQPGQVVSACQTIGLSGWSGYVMPPGPRGAHLHFGIRINPYDLCSPYCGYSNPLPYLVKRCSSSGTISFPRATDLLLPILLIGGAIIVLGTISRGHTGRRSYAT
jgi:murein DD-endopeptidase MepM/ murein hydrolase activator NlpD